MIQNRQRRVPVSLASLEGFLARVRERLRLPADSLGVCLVGDAAIARWNQVYRGKFGPTDVLSFQANGNHLEHAASSAAKRGRKNSGKLVIPKKKRAMHDESFPATLSSTTYLGDIAISPSAALRNARRMGRTLPKELRILVLHGILHLMGYDHETDRGQMKRRESRLRRELGLS
jgi:rRNA maturation RNase YbeY